MLTMVSLRAQVVATMVAVSVVSAALVGIPLHSASRGLLEAEMVDRLVGAAETAAVGFPTADALADTDGSGRAAREEQLEIVREEAGLRNVWLVARDGRIVAGDHVHDGNDADA